MLSLQAIMKDAYNMPFDYVKFGKPYRNTFEFAESIVR